jgi:metal-responsive CopG/Arc/MetJ family transcriptional regulator
MTSAAKVAISLRAETFRALEATRKRLGRSRSAIVDEALRLWLDQQDLSAADRVYAEGYLRKPEGTNDATARAVVSTWDDWK